MKKPSKARSQENILLTSNRRYEMPMRENRIGIFALLAISVVLILKGVAIAGTEKEKLNELKPEMKQKIEILLKQSRAKWPNLKIIVSETYRPQSRQDMLYKKGSHFTTVKTSKHTKRIAADIYFIKNGRIANYEQAPYLELGIMAEKLGLVWGGRWKRPFDPGHFEMR